MANLVIVESPTKARTLSKYLGKDYRIEASMGHIRDLPKSEMGVDLTSFDPKYIVPRDKKKKVNELKKAADAAETIYLASDPDREGEAIAWHLAALLGGSALGVARSKKNNNPPHTSHAQIKRVEFHEITEGAIKEAFNHPREINIPLVDAQQARRILDRLVGYKLSPLLWKKVKRGLSAGRVQTVALRLIVEREREIEAFKPVEYWSIVAELRSEGQKISKASLRDGESEKVALFRANLIEHNGKKLVIKGEEKGEGKNFSIDSKEVADQLLVLLNQAAYSVKQVIKKEVKRGAAPPYTTSTLQQASGNKLGYSAKKTMMLAQNLYENGFITYMRTDSVNLSQFALEQARDYIKGKYGENYLPASARVFKSKSKNAQEAHEAIRPTNVSVTPDQIEGKNNFTAEHRKLYDLIWKRTVASQMSDAVVDQTTIDVTAESSQKSIVSNQTSLPSNEGQTTGSEQNANGLSTDYFLFRATGSVIKFDGWMKLYPGVRGQGSGSRKKQNDVIPSEVEGSADSEKDKPEETEQMLPAVSEGDKLDLQKLLPEQHFTEPPARYTESSLIKKLEQLGIGRPSTYAPTLSTIQDRFYVEKFEKKFKPTPLGMAATDFLIKYFPEVFDYGFTASMEDKLDDVAKGARSWKETIKEFFGPFEKKLESTEGTAEKMALEVETVDKQCPVCGKQLVVRQGKFGKFLACSGFPDCKHTESFDQPIETPCPKCGGDVVLRKTKKGRPFYGCKNYPNCDFASWTKPGEEKKQES